jgi:hypothetical protein
MSDPHMIPGGSLPGDLHHLLGKRVRVRLQNRPQIVSEGTLLGYGDGGDIELEGGDGLVYHCWPALRVEPLE